MQVPPSTCPRALVQDMRTRQWRVLYFWVGPAPGPVAGHRSECAVVLTWAKTLVEK